MNSAQELAAAGARGSRRFAPRDKWAVFSLIACTFILYCRTAHFDFVLFDDPLYVSSNTFVIQGLSLRSLRWAMTATPNGNWHPLTAIVQLTISTVFGLKPGAFHLFNVLLHALNAAMLFLFFRRGTGLFWPALLTALLWGLHPLRVESVAWISELKDVLCGAFWLGCMLAYLKFARRRTVGGFLLVMLLDALSLLGKPMAITLPAALLLLDYWPLSQVLSTGESVPIGRWWLFRVLEKLPLLALSVADLLAQKNQLLFASSELPFTFRLENAVVSCVCYLRDLVLPYHLAVFYPHPYFTGQSINMMTVAACAGLLIVISIAAVLCVKSRPYLAVGWFWFIGTLVPVLGLVQVGEQSRADRFTYIPCIGITFAVVWLLNDISAGRRGLQIAGLVTAGAATVVLVVISARDIAPWRDTDSLFQQLYRLQPDNYFALTMVGSRSFDRGQSDAGLAMQKRAVAIAPRSFHTHAEYGHSLRRAGRLGEAREQFVQSLRIDPTESQSWAGLAEVYASEADLCAAHHNPEEQKFRQLAINDFQKSIDIDPSTGSAQDHLAFQLSKLPGRLDDAIGIWNQRLITSPGDADAHGHLADVLWGKGDIDGATAHYAEALRSGSKNPDWEAALAFLVGSGPRSGQVEIQDVIVPAKDACDQTRNQNPDALDAYAVCLARLGRFDDAVTTARLGIDQAKLQKNSTLADQMQQRLALYLQGRPFVENR